MKQTRQLLMTRPGFRIQFHDDVNLSQREIVWVDEIQAMAIPFELRHMGQKYMCGIDVMSVPSLLRGKNAKRLSG